MARGKKAPPPEEAGPEPIVRQCAACGDRLMDDEQGPTCEGCQEAMRLATAVGDYLQDKDAVTIARFSNGDMTDDEIDGLATTLAIAHVTADDFVNAVEDECLKRVAARDDQDDEEDEQAATESAETLANA